MDNIQFTEIVGIGDAAGWDHMFSALAELEGKVSFEISVKSDDLDENFALAKNWQKRFKEM